MNILKAIKAWWKPEVKEEKVRVRFNRTGSISSVYYPASCSNLQESVIDQEVNRYNIKIARFDMRNKVDGFQHRNQDRKAVEEMRSAMYNMARQQEIGIMAGAGAGAGAQY